jgi:hypothetical protein
MDIKEVDSKLNDFLLQNRIYEPQYKAFEVKLLSQFSGNKDLHLYIKNLLTSLKKDFKDGVYCGNHSLEKLKQKVNPQPLSPKPKKEKVIQERKKTLNPKPSPKLKKQKPKYVVPQSKNRISEQDAILIKLKIEYVRKPFTILSFAEELQFQKESLLEVIRSCGFEDVNYDARITMDYITPIAEQVFDRRNELIAYNTEIVSKQPKTKPNYFKLIYNSPGSKR